MITSRSPVVGKDVIYRRNVAGRGEFTGHEPKREGYNKAFEMDNIAGGKATFETWKKEAERHD